MPVSRTVNEDYLKNMKLHSLVIVKKKYNKEEYGVTILRVPGGWLYATKTHIDHSGHVTFVPEPEERIEINTYDQMMMDLDKQTLDQVGGKQRANTKSS